MAEDEHITIGIIQGEVPLAIGLIGRRIAHIGKATDLLAQRIDLVGAEIERNAAPDGRAVSPIIRAVAITSNPLPRYQSIKRCISLMVSIATGPSIFIYI